MLRLVSVGFMFVSCASSEKSAEQIDSGSVENTLDTSDSVVDTEVPTDTGMEVVDCVLPVPSRFLSVDEFEIGLGPDGAVMGHWSISFSENNAFIWNYSDVKIHQLPR